MSSILQYTLLFSKELDIVSMNSTIVKNINTARKSSNTLSFNKRNKVLQKINKSRHSEDLSIGDAVVVHHNNPTKLQPRIMDERYTIDSIIGHKVIKLVDRFGRTIVRGRKHVRKVVL